VGEITLTTTTLTEGLQFPEGPRWHDGKLWFSDMNAGKVMTVDLSGHLNTIVHVPGSPSGLGWLPDDRLLVVSMTDRRLLRFEKGGLIQAADLFDLATYHCNDMVVDSNGRAYIGNFGFDLGSFQEVVPAEIIMVRQDGDAAVVAGDLLFPNGMVITPDGKTLIVAETFGQRLTAFDILPDGMLGNRRVWAEMKGYYPDGICLDEEGGIWVASPENHAGVLRVLEGGSISHRVQVESNAYACMLGNHDRRTLFVLTAGAFTPRQPEAGGRIETIEVEIPGAGLP
jgi:sugar lactone lactonase YvrE